MPKRPTSDPAAPATSGGTPVAVRLLGGFELRCDGSRVVVPPASQRLIAFLALHDRPLLRLHVAGRLWSDVEESRSYANLRSALWRLRQPDSPVVEATATHIRLARTVVVDVHELVRVARRLVVRPDDALETAFDDGPLEEDLLPDWYEEWVGVERERLRQLRLHAVEAAAAHALAHHRPERAVDLALGALRGDPLRESLHELVIRTHLSQGNFAEAIRHHRGHLAPVESQLGLRPDPELARLLRSPRTPV